MSEEQSQSTTEETLGQEFWTQPTQALNEIFNLMYMQSLSVLRDEVRERGGAVIDYMLAERIAFLYAYLRQREADPENDLTDRNRREMSKDWLELATTMKKLWNSEDKANQSELVLKKVNRAVFEALKDMPESQASAVRGALAESFENAGL